jgi:hypothetical protein
LDDARSLPALHAGRCQAASVAEEELIQNLKNRG